MTLVAEPESERPDLTTFVAIQKRVERTGRRMPWSERAAIIRRQFPSVATLDWRDALSDTDLWGRIMEDILKVDQAEPGRDGPRPNLDYDKGVSSLRRIMGDDYSTLDFRGAFEVLARDRSLSHLESKTGLERTRLHRLRHGHVEPNAEDMEAIAKGFGKHPSYFVEYRAAFVVAAIANQLLLAPEATVNIYRKMLGKA